MVWVPEGVTSLISLAGTQHLPATGGDGREGADHGRGCLLRSDQRL